MKRKISVIFILLALLCQGCSETQLDVTLPVVNSEMTSIENTHASPGTSANVIICTDIYEVTKSEGLYSYALFDTTGNVVKIENNLPQEPKIEHIENDVIRVTRQAGTGIGTQSGYYYDQKNNAISPIFQCIFDENNGIVAHATMDKVIVESIFNDDFYKEIGTFQKPFSDVAFPFINVEFDENGHIVYVSYYSGTDYEVITEAVPLSLAEPTETT